MDSLERILPHEENRVQTVIARAKDRNLQSAALRALTSIFQSALTSLRSKRPLSDALRLWHISSTCVWSAHQRWRIRISTNTVDFGPALRRLPDGSLQPDRRTLMRSECIGNLLATRPWADIVDVQIFLAGFDAGEQWCRRNLDSERSKHAGA